MQEARQLRHAAGGGQAAGEVGAAAAGRHQVDIDSLAFNEGSHTMSNADCTLPKSSYRTSFKVGQKLAILNFPSDHVLGLESM